MSYEFKNAIITVVIFLSCLLIMSMSNFFTELSIKENPARLQCYLMEGDWRDRKCWTIEKTITYKENR